MLRCWEISEALRARLYSQRLRMDPMKCSLADAPLRLTAPTTSRAGDEATAPLFLREPWRLSEPSRYSRTTPLPTVTATWIQRFSGMSLPPSTSARSL